MDLPNSIHKKTKINKKHVLLEIEEEITNKEEINNKEEITTEKYTLMDLFCGTGAFSLAFHQTNQVKTIFANDLLDSSREIFNLNNQEVKLTQQTLMDIPDADIPKADIITAGFPCQPFSVAGMQKGLADERSNAFWKMLSILQHHSPPIVVLENVKNLQSHDHGKTFQIMVEHLKQLDYHLCYAVLNTSKITGIPQNRERIYIVGFKDKSKCDAFDMDFPEIPLKPIAEFLETDIPEKYYYSPSSAIYHTLKEHITKPHTIYQYRRYYVRENKHQVCPTLTANMGGGGHNVPLWLDEHGIRKLTPRECFNLQGFPKDYILPPLCDSKLYALAGNAVSVPVVQLIANKIMSLGL